MEERKVAAIVLAVLLIIATITLYIRNINERTLSFRTCTVHVDNISGLEADSYCAAKNVLALCLCNVYIKKTDTAVANQIITIYRQYGIHARRDSFNSDNTKPIDSIIKYKSVVFDTLVLVD